MLNFPNIDPVIISFGPLAISWYSLSYVVGIIIGWQYAIKLVTNNNTRITKLHIDDFISWVIIGIIIAGRLGYVLLYDPAKYFSDPILILKTYEGGMSFHGGIIGFISAAFFFSRRNKISFLTLLDISAAATPIALFLGRIANFINAELYGRVTDVSWAVIFPGSDYLPRHPSQLYEAALEGVILFIILFIVAVKYKGLLKPGLISGLFLTFYSLFRIFSEIFREPDIQIGFLAGGATMGQLLSLPMLLIGLVLCFYSRKLSLNV